MINGFKAFNGNMSNNYNKVFYEGKDYYVDGEIKFGLKGNGYHFAKRIEDTFRYINDKENISIAKVYSNGEVLSFDDEYYGYYDLYVSNHIHIEKVLKRNEIISEILKNGESALKRFIATGFKLTNEELLALTPYINENVFKYIEFYYHGKDYNEVFSLEKKLVLKK